jgi:hypothetical protein
MKRMANKRLGIGVGGTLLALALTLANGPAAQAAPSAMTRQGILDLAVSGVGYSYYWGQGSWRMDGTETGSCSGSCPSCSHSGSYGADCSGFVAKAWQVPGPSNVTTNSHPYSTSNFRWEENYWSQIPRGDALVGDAFVYRNSGNTSGHVVIYESGDPWGSSWVYEARGCSYGIVHRLKSIGSTYVAIRRNALSETACATVPAAGRVIDQDESCFELGGPMAYWRTEQSGWNGSLKWTHATDTQVYNYALWHLDLEQAGRYVLEAYTPAAWAESQQANYQVRHGGVTTPTVVDQTAVDGWVTVGEFDFAAGDGQWVRLEDLTGEPGSSDTRVVFDALRLTLVPETPSDPVDPGDPEDPSDPVDPGDPEDPNDPADPIDPGDTGNPPTPTCEPVPPTGRVIDDTELCFEQGGPAEYWRFEQAGFMGGLRWTHATANTTYNFAVWRLSFLLAGTYKIEAYTAAPWAKSRQARYQVRHDGTTTTFDVDQTATDGWTTVGKVEFASGGAQWVRLEDLTGESNDSDTRVVADAIRISWVDQPTPYAPNLGDKDLDRLGKVVGGCATSGISSSGAPPAGALWCVLLLLWILRRSRRRI